MRCSSPITAAGPSPILTRFPVTLKRDPCITPPFARLLCQAQISARSEAFALSSKYSNVFLWLKLSPSLYLAKIRCSSKVSIYKHLNVRTCYIFIVYKSINFIKKGAKDSRVRVQKDTGRRTIAPSVMQSAMLVKGNFPIQIFSFCEKRRGFPRSILLLNYHTRKQTMALYMLELPIPISVFQLPVHNINILLLMPVMNRYFHCSERKASQLNFYPVYDGNHQQIP